MSTASDIDEGDVSGGGNGGHGTTQPPPVLPFTLYEQRQNDNDQNGPRYHEMTSNVSPSCARTDLYEDRSARSGGGGIMQPPLLVNSNSRPSGLQNRVDVDTEAVEARAVEVPSISASTSNKAE